ncbi:MAG: hypothetical protein MSC31_18965 [Solirubrobacteraceae bacterium MAG38_C4-C5]|nr:hypothetical protein [Candidatus Siliceabacter maunaloa]
MLLATAFALCALLQLPGPDASSAEVQLRDTAVGKQTNAPRGCGTVTRPSEGLRVSRITAYRKLRCSEARVTVARMIRADRIGGAGFDFGQWSCTTRSGGIVDCDKGRGTTKRMTFRDVSPEILLADCSIPTYGARAEPTRWDAGCTGVPELDGMSWQEWGGRLATGSGLTRVNDCVPDCAEGTVYQFPAAATVSRIRSCVDERGQVAWFYTRVGYSYTMPAGHPLGGEPGPVDGEFEMLCPQYLRCEDAGPNHTPAYEIETRRATCVQARRVASDAQRRATVCRGSRCVREVRGFRCSFRRIVATPGEGSYRPVGCIRGSSRVNFRLAFD